MPKFFSNAAYRAMARFTSPAAAAALDTALASSQTAADLVPIAAAASQVAVFGKLLEIDATAGNVVATAPNPVGAAGQSWGMILKATASAHTMVAAPHAAETFDGGAAPAATAVVGAMYQFTSDGTNWLITAKI